MNKHLLILSYSSSLVLFRFQKSSAIHADNNDKLNEYNGSFIVSNGNISSNRRTTHVIIGYGDAGKAAYKEIIRKDESSTVIIVDSNCKEKSFRNRTTVIRAAPKELDIVSKVLKLDNNNEISFEKCLISIGNETPSKISRFIDVDSKHRIFDVKLKKHRHLLFQEAAKGAHVTVLGSNWNAVDVSLQLAEIGRSFGYRGNITLVTPMSGLLAGTLPKYLSIALTKRLSSRGVEIIPNSQIQYITESLPEHIYKYDSNNNRSLFSAHIFSNAATPLGIYISKTYDSLWTALFPSDAVVLCTDVVAKYKETEGGSREFLHTPGLELDPCGALIANSFLMASSDIYVAGDLASIQSPIGRTVFSGVDHAVESGKVAGANMTGGRLQYAHIPLYEAASDTAGVHLMMVGHCSAALESHGYWWRLPPSRCTPSLVSEIAPSNVVGSSSSLWSSLTAPDFRHHSSTISKSAKQKEDKGVPLGKLKQKFIDPSAAGPLIDASVGSRLNPSPALLNSVGIVFYVDSGSGSSGSAGAIVGVLVSGLKYWEVSPEAKKDFVIQLKNLLGKEILVSNESPIFVAGSHMISQHASQRLALVQNLSSLAGELVSGFHQSDKDRSSQQVTYRNSPVSQAAVWSQEQRTARRGPVPEHLFTTGSNPDAKR